MIGLCWVESILVYGLIEFVNIDSAVILRAKLGMEQHSLVSEGVLIYKYVNSSLILLLVS